MYHDIISRAFAGIAAWLLINGIIYGSSPNYNQHDLYCEQHQIARQTLCIKFLCLL
jgi:hypothetical protein